MSHSTQAQSHQDCDWSQDLRKGLKRERSQESTSRLHKPRMSHSTQARSHQDLSAHCTVILYL
ncbi:hypothetical protein M404DRAFT_991575 [Pisolithus tinctorius Marx 270]|uniref:Uncharacterized protein n=1 Tax=Pisolithus tinctorius Marx 270 TaxID=870435 RepID=A0A0C3PZI8_PISTI|nr:hypothetical protein M404DRAFT_991575 [Pisolithus tinctorius Marx 270]